MTIEMMMLFFGFLIAVVFAGMKYGSRLMNWCIGCAWEQEWSRAMISKMNSPSAPKPKKEVKE